MAEKAVIPTWTAARAERARAFKARDPERAERALADLKAAKLRDHIKAVVDTAPKLSPAQIDELSLILRGARTRKDAA